MPNPVNAAARDAPLIAGVVANLPLFCGLPPAALQSLAAGSWTTGAMRGEPLVRMGARLPGVFKQPLRDNATTLIGQVRDKRGPFTKADAEAIRTPTLFIGGARTKGMLQKVLHALAAHVQGSKVVMIPNTTHPMFEQAPQTFSEIVLEFLAD